MLYKKQNMHQHLFFFLLVLCLFSISTTYALHYGQLVTVEKRSQFSDERTKWSTLIPSKSPHFKVPTSVILNGISGQTRHVTSTLKISFRIQVQRFITPWIVVADVDESEYLTQIDMDFHYSGDSILKVNVHTHYTSEANQLDMVGNAPKYIALNYRWQEVVEHDKHSPTLFLFIVTILITIVMILSYYHSIPEYLKGGLGGHSTDFLSQFVRSKK